MHREVPASVRYFISRGKQVAAAIADNEIGVHAMLKTSRFLASVPIILVLLAAVPVHAEDPVRKAARSFARPRRRPLPANQAMRRLLPTKELATIRRNGHCLSGWTPIGNSRS